MNSKPVVYKRTAWEILGISPMATDDEVKRAFEIQSGKFSPKYYPEYKGNEIYCNKMESVFKLINEAFNSLGGWETNKEDRKKYNRRLNDEDMARDQVNMPILKEVGLNGIVRWFTFSGSYSIEGVEGNIKPEDFEFVERTIFDAIVRGVETKPGDSGYQMDYETTPPVNYGGVKNHGIRQKIREVVDYFNSPRKVRERQRDKGFERGMKIARENEEIRRLAMAESQRRRSGNIVDINNYRDKREENMRDTAAEDRRQINNWEKGDYRDTRNETNINPEIKKPRPVSKEREFESGISREYSPGIEGRKG